MIASLTASIMRGLGFLDERRCPQCYRMHPRASFIGARGSLVKWCASCRERYRNWNGLSTEQRAR